ncbi:hypothetical protein SAY87_011097 [Trapa incisa]|uniref:Uncharacterized protein n=1 Tax=Trapa incisa TaxID=236973 RepID=A0AAN7GF40_9MYRT|nr:hypothetical protein SAY87_011097 [Trapa incisa]
MVPLEFWIIFPAVHSDLVVLSSVKSPSRTHWNLRFLLTIKWARELLLLILWFWAFQTVVFMAPLLPFSVRWPANVDPTGKIDRIIYGLFDAALGDPLSIWPRWKPRNSMPILASSRQ